MRAMRSLGKELNVITYLSPVCHTTCACYATWMLCPAAAAAVFCAALAVRSHRSYRSSSSSSSSSSPVDSSLFASLLFASLPAAAVGGAGATAFERGTRQHPALQHVLVNVKSDSKSTHVTTPVAGVSLPIAAGASARCPHSACGQGEGEGEGEGKGEGEGEGEGKGEGEGEGEGVGVGDR